MDYSSILHIPDLSILQRLVRAPTTEEWERFKKYTGRVVELYVGKGYSGEVSSETFAFLGMQSTVDPLWPRLTSLRLTNRPGWDIVASTLAFLSPKIKTLALTLPRDPGILLQPILSIASDKCRRVQELTLDVVADDSYSAHKVGGLISACRDTLRSLEINSPFKAEYIPIIANMPQLRSLHLERVHFSCDIPSGAFPALEEFTFPHFQGRRLQHFLTRLGTTNLKVAKIQSIDAISFKKSMVALSKFSASLVHLEIAAVTGLDPLSVPASRLPFANLRNVQLRCFRWGQNFHDSCPFRPSDEAVAELGEAMPNLNHLALGSPTCPNLQCTTFLSLVSLSKTCKDLETLEIKVDFQTMIAPNILGSKNVRPGTTSGGTRGKVCKLHKLSVGSSTLPEYPESAWMVAIGLGKIFPSLTEVEGYGFERSKWEQVSGNVRMFRQVFRNLEC